MQAVAIFNIASHNNNCWHKSTACRLPDFRLHSRCRWDLLSSGSLPAYSGNLLLTFRDSLSNFLFGFLVPRRSDPIGCPETSARNCHCTLPNIAQERWPRRICFQNVFGVVSQFARERVRRRFLVWKVSVGQQNTVAVSWCSGRALDCIIVAFIRGFDCYVIMEFSSNCPLSFTCEMVCPPQLFVYSSLFQAVVNISIVIPLV